MKISIYVTKSVAIFLVGIILREGIKIGKVYTYLIMNIYMLNVKTEVKQT